MNSPMLKEFREFILRGNLIDLAVAVVIGTAFAALVTALTESLITPLISAIGGQPDFSDLSFSIGKSTFTYGDFFNALISFLIVAAVVFFFVVRPTNHLIDRFKKADGPGSRDCPECLSSIPKAARRCAYCTAAVEPVA